MKDFLARALLCIALFSSLAACGRATPTSILEITSTEELTMDDVQVLDLGDQADFEEGECPFRMPENMPRGRVEVQCGTLIVPEDRRETDGAKIRLPAAIYKSQGENLQPDPLLILVSGTGPFLQFSMYMTFLFDEIYSNRDLIMLELRGTGYSEPALSCPGLSELYFGSLEQDPYAREVINQAVEIRESCVQAWKGEGIELSAYTTAEIAADLEALRTTLGIRQWNIFANGFSTRLAFELARSYPAGVRSMILDTAFPPQVEYMAENAANAQRVLDLLFEYCAEDKQCNEAFPDLENTFYDLVDQLNAAPVLVEVSQLETGQRVNVLLTGDRLIYTMLLGLGNIFDERILPELPRMIYQLRSQRYDVFETVFGSVMANAAPVNEGLSDLILCNEELLLTPAEKIRQANRRTNPQLEGYANRQLDMYTQICEVLRFLEPLQGVKEPVTSSIPTLFLSGDFTTDASPAWADLAASSLSQSYHIRIPGAGTLAAVSTKYRACAQGMMTAFLADPMTKPDAACAAAEPDFLWITLE